MYLSCVENDIYTVQDAIDKGLLTDELAGWASELKVFVEEDSKTTGSSEAEAKHAIDEESIEDTVQSLFSGLSVRSRNALDSILRFDCYKSYKAFYLTITSPDFKVKNIRNVGKKSIPEIERFISLLKVRVSNVASSKDKKEESINYDAYTTIFEGKLKALSARSLHAVDALFEACGRSLNIFIPKVTSPDFKAARLPAIGKKSSAEIESWLKDLLDILKPGSDAIINAEREAKIRDYVSRGLRGDCSKIVAKCEILGHFPFLFAIQSYIDALPEREQGVILAQLKIYKNQQLENRKKSAKSLHITPERMRQLRIALFQKLKEFIISLSSFKDAFPLFSYTKAEVEQNNNLEGTSFNENFVFWTIALLWHDEYTLLGDVDAAFMNPYGNEKNLALVSSKHSTIYRFDKLTDYFEILVQEKRVEDVSISLQEVSLRFFKNRVYYEHLDEIIKEIKDVLSRFFDFEIVGDEVRIAKNSTRNNTDWAELILREVGHPMTVDEIYEELERRHPGKSKSSIAFAGAVRTNPNLAPIGRSSIFGLKEWTKGEKRGGTIREFATEYLLSLQYPIATLEDIGNYVRQYRPSSSDKSINANLLLEANGSFSVYYKDAIRYIGLTNYTYPDEYRRFNQVADAKRSFRTSCTLLEEFVAEHGRMPFSSDVSEDEKRLARFWNVRTSQLKKGQLEGDERDIILSMVSKFEGLRVSKKEYDWQQNYRTIKTAFENGFGVSSLSIEKQEWLSNQLRNYKYHSISVEHAALLDELILIMKANAKRV